MFICDVLNGLGMVGTSVSQCSGEVARNALRQLLEVGIHLISLEQLQRHHSGCLRHQQLEDPRLNALPLSTGVIVEQRPDEPRVISPYSAPSAPEYSAPIVR
jgi:hypothetical protein